MGQLKGIFLGALLATLAWMGVERLPASATETQLGIQYVDHSHDPHVVLGVREHGSQYTYKLDLRLVSEGEGYQVPCDVMRVELSDVEWEYWRRVDTDPWKSRETRKRNSEKR